MRLRPMKSLSNTGVPSLAIEIGARLVAQRSSLPLPVIVAGSTTAALHMIGGVAMNHRHVRSMQIDFIVPSTDFDRSALLVLHEIKYHVVLPGGHVDQLLQKCTDGTIADMPALDAEEEKLMRMFLRRDACKHLKGSPRFFFDVRLLAGQKRKRSARGQSRTLSDKNTDE